MPAATSEQSPRTRPRNDTCRTAIKLVKKKKEQNTPQAPREALPRRGKKKAQAHSRSSQKVHIVRRFQGLTKMAMQKKRFIVFVFKMSAEAVCEIVEQQRRGWFGEEGAQLVCTERFARRRASPAPRRLDSRTRSVFILRG